MTTSTNREGERDRGRRVWQETERETESETWNRQENKKEGKSRHNTSSDDSHEALQLYSEVQRWPQSAGVSSDQYP